MCEHALLPSRRRWGGSAPFCKLGKRHCEESRVVGCRHPERLLTCSCAFLEFFLYRSGNDEPALCSPCNELYFVYWCSGIILCRSQKRRWSRASESVLCPPHSSAYENFSQTFRNSTDPKGLLSCYIFVLETAACTVSFLTLGTTGAKLLMPPRTISQTVLPFLPGKDSRNVSGLSVLTFLNIINCHDVLFFSCPSIVNESASWFSLIYFPWWSCHL